MNQKTRFVFNGIINLSRAEQQEIIQALQERSGKNAAEKLNEEYRNFSYIEKAINEGRKIGPTDENVCTCCGR